MRCPNCNSNISLWKAKANFYCPSCGTQLLVKGTIWWHVCASIVFVVFLVVLYGMRLEVAYFWLALPVSVFISYWVSFLAIVRVKKVADNKKEKHS